MKRFSAFGVLLLFLLFTMTGCVRDDDQLVALKPVIYLYPEETTTVNVTLEYKGELTCTYPAYGNGWAVTACPDGTLTDDAGQTYSYLYWEGTSGTDYDFSTGFCVAGSIFSRSSCALYGAGARILMPFSPFMT